MVVQSGSAVSRPRQLRALRAMLAHVLLRLSRDSVAAGDDVVSHDEDRVVDRRRPLERFVAELFRDGYLPSIQGGRATWILRTGIRGEAIGVAATRVGRLDSFRLTVGRGIDLGEVGDALHFQYEAQRDPDEVLAELRAP